MSDVRRAWPLVGVALWLLPGCLGSAELDLAPPRPAEAAAAESRRDLALHLSVTADGLPREVEVRVLDAHGEPTWECEDPAPRVGAPLACSRADDWFRGAGTYRIVLAHRGTDGTPEGVDQVFDAYGDEHYVQAHAHLDRHGRHSSMEVVAPRRPPRGVHLELAHGSPEEALGFILVNDSDRGFLVARSEHVLGWIVHRGIRPFATAVTTRGVCVRGVGQSVVPPGGWERVGVAGGTSAGFERAPAGDYELAVHGRAASADDGRRPDRMVTLPFRSPGPGDRQALTAPPGPVTW